MAFSSSRVRPFLIVLALLLLAPGLLPAQEEPRWTPLGPWGGSVNRIAIHPTNPQILYASGDLPGVVRSTDGGVSWKLLPGSPFRPYFVVLDPSRPATVYSGQERAAEVYRSTDGGASWRPLKVGPASGLSGLEVTTFAVDPLKGSRLYAGTTKGVWKSENGGASWQRLVRGLPNGGNTLVYVLGVPQRPAGTVYISTVVDGVFRTSNGGGLWQPVRLPAQNLGELAVSPSDARTLYATFPGSDRVFRSDNGGNSWVPLSQPEGVSLAALAVHPRLPRTVYGKGFGPGLFKSTDGGGSWLRIGSPAADDAFPLAISPSSQTVYARPLFQGADPGGVLRSLDGGATWERRTLGIPGRSAYSVAVDPADPGVLVTTVLGGLFRSANGSRFARTNAGEPSPPTETVQLGWLLAPGPGTFYAVDFRRPLVWKSTDAGVTWTSQPSPAGQVVSLRADPADPDTLYAMAQVDFPNHGLFRSLDGGASWTPLALPTAYCGLAGFTVARPSASSPAVLYLAGTRTLEANCDLSKVAAVFRSSDGGSSWTDASEGLPKGAAITAGPLTTDPQDSRVVYAGILSLRPNAPKGLWKSTDSGATWQRLSLPRLNVTALASSPVPGVLWVGLAGGSVYRSDDAGATWEDRSGGQVLEVGDFVFDPADPERVYASGFGGVWVTEE